MSFSVYCLADPRTSEVRYVGYSKYPEARFASHCKDISNTHKARWVAKLHREAGLVPVLSVQCIVETAAEAKRIEVALIALYKSRGVRLTNGTAGGDGVVDPTPEAREKHASAIRGKPLQFTAEHRKALSEARQRLLASGWSFSHKDDTKARISVAMLGRPSTHDVAGGNNPFFRKTHSEETRRQISVAKKGKGRGEHNAFFGHRHSEQARIKMCRSQRRRRWNELFVETARLQPQLMRSVIVTSRLLQTAQAKEN